ncbi:MAG: type I DNA topoisomerase [Planctomycetes bacterium]|nr:type I DNA topoisomerase [Planctomycetota bacterium]
MKRSLVIVESPAKAKTINKFLGEGFVVEASLGHVRDLPAKRLGIDPENGFTAEYVVIPEREKNIRRLRKLSREAEMVYLALDLDREGEAIAWHLQEVLGLGVEKSRRVTFNEITPGAIRRAFASPGSIDQNKVNAQQARRILDRIVGYKLSPLLWKKVMMGLSAGRVQSVAVRLIAEREREIRAFVPEEFWKVVARLRPLAGASETLASPGTSATSFEAELRRWDGKPLKLADQASATRAVEELRDPATPWRVAGVDHKDKHDHAPPPFITSTLQQLASNRLRFGTDRTMRVAQQLYEGIEVGPEGAVGLITYMRTDSLNVSRDAVEELRGYILRELGKPYLPEKPRGFRSRKGAQEAHEAIRPTSVERTPERMKPYLSGEQLRLYDLIWRRFVASQMESALYAVTTVEVEAGRYGLGASGRVLRFDGYLRVAGRRDDAGDADAPAAADLPPLEEGQALDCLEVTPSQHFTQPPARYTEATLVKTLEKEGIGRPSTYASIIKTIKDRRYVELRDRKFHATDLGIIVSDKLTEHFPRLMDTEFTSRMEEKLDSIEGARVEWRSVLEEFHGQFAVELEKASREMKGVHEDPQPSGVACAKCGRAMVYKLNRWGRFLGCSGYPECRNALPVDSEGRPQEVEGTGQACELCGEELIIRHGRNGRFVACSGYPECRNTKSVDEQGNVITPREAGVACEKCGKPMVVRSGRRGRFVACTGYPGCRNTKPLDKEGNIVQTEAIARKCEKCGSAMVVRMGRRGKFVACTGFPRCRHTVSMEAYAAEQQEEGTGT